jgi:hypothetical protein
MKTKYTLHKLPEGFIVTSDETLNEGNTIININNFEIVENWQGHGSTDWWRKVIAQQNHIDFSGLSEEEQKKIGWFDVEKLSLISMGSTDKRHHTASGKIAFNRYIEGFQKAQELLSERFTLEDVQIAITQAFLSGMERIEEITDVQNHIIQSLSQKSWKIELEMENYCGSPYITEKCPKCIDTCDRAYFRPKLTNGKITITKIL